MRAQRDGNGDLAEAEYALAARADPFFAKTYNALGLLRLEQRRLDDAIDAFARAAERDPRFAEAYSNLGFALLMQGRADEALAELGTAVELRPLLAKAHDLRALIQLRKGDARAALSSFLASIAAEPDRFEPYSQAAWILAAHPDASIRNGAQALALAQQMSACSNAADAPLTGEVLAAAFAECGRYDEAIQNAHRAAELYAQRGDTGRVAAVRNQMLLYAKHQPYRDPSLAGPGAGP
jgi:tetratricopeptide (TPR) repeat protein